MCGFNPCNYKSNQQEKNDKADGTQINADSSIDVANTAVFDNEPNSEDECSEQRNKNEKVNERKDQKVLNDKKHKNNQSTKWNDKTDQEKAFTVLKYAGIGLAAAGVAVVAAVPVIGVIGFTSVGVAGGSLAAAFQSSVLGGIIAKGSFFALLQSAGATGAIAGTSQAIIGGTAGGLAVGVTKAVTEIKSAIKKKSSKCPVKPSPSSGNDSANNLQNNPTTVKRQEVKKLTRKNVHPFEVSTNSSIHLYLHV